MGFELIGFEDFWSRSPFKLQYSWFSLKVNFFEKLRIFVTQKLIVLLFIVFLKIHLKDIFKTRVSVPKDVKFYE